MVIIIIIIIIKPYQLLTWRIVNPVSCASCFFWSSEGYGCWKEEISRWIRQYKYIIKEPELAMNRGTEKTNEGRDLKKGATHWKGARAADDNDPCNYGDAWEQVIPKEAFRHNGACHGELDTAAHNTTKSETRPFINKRSGLRDRWNNNGSGKIRIVSKVTLVETDKDGNRYFFRPFQMRRGKVRNWSSRHIRIQFPQI